VSELKKNLTEFYDDIELCYKGMGLTFSDTPDKVDKVYNSLVAKYTSDMKSSAPGVRQAAKDNLEQMKELHERITSSMIYKDYAREYEKYMQYKEENKQARRQKQEAERESMAICPHCNRQIPAKQKVCIYCQGKIMSPMDQLMGKVFSTRNLVVAAIVILFAIAAVVLLSNPQLLKR
jgi:hypothetical protein